VFELPASGELNSMRSVWLQRIKRFDRELKPLECLRLRKERRLRTLRERQGRPSRALPLELVLKRLELRRISRAVLDGEFAARPAKLEFEEARTRLLERKRNALAKVRARRTTKESSGINCWRRRRDLLAKIEALRQRADLDREGRQAP